MYVLVSMICWEFFSLHLLNESSFLILTKKPTQRIVCLKISEHGGGLRTGAQVEVEGNFCVPEH